MSRSLIDLKVFSLALSQNVERRNKSLEQDHCLLVSALGYAAKDGSIDNLNKFASSLKAAHADAVKAWIRSNCEGWMKMEKGKYAIVKNTLPLRDAWLARIDEYLAGRAFFEATVKEQSDALAFNDAYVIKAVNRLIDRVQKGSTEKINVGVSPAVAAALLHLKSELPTLQ